MEWVGAGILKSGHFRGVIIIFVKDLLLLSSPLDGKGECYVF